jgi:hypothetical protein
MANTFRKGDIVEIKYQGGSDNNGKPIIKTLEGAEVLSCDGNHLKVGYRVVPNSPTGEVDFIERSFDMSSPDFVGAQCVK